jgi:hypothetical protein
MERGVGGNTSLSLSLFISPPQATSHQPVHIYPSTPSPPSSNIPIPIKSTQHLHRPFHYLPISLSHHLIYISRPSPSPSLPYVGPTTLTNSPRHPSLSRKKKSVNTPNSSLFPGRPRPIAERRNRFLPCQASSLRVKSQQWVSQQLAGTSASASASVLSEIEQLCLTRVTAASQRPFKSLLTSRFDLV